MMGQLSDLAKDECEEIGIGGVGLDVLMAGIHGGALERYLQVDREHQNTHYGWYLVQEQVQMQKALTNIRVNCEQFVVISPSLHNVSLQVGFKFGNKTAVGANISADGLIVTSVSLPDHGWRGAILDPLVRTEEQSYVEFVVEEVPAGEAHVCLGVTTLEHPPAPERLPVDWSRRTSMHCSAACVFYSCRFANCWPGGRDFGAAGEMRRGDRAGLLLRGGSLWVFVNGARQGGGAMAEGLPPAVRFAVELSEAGYAVRVVPGAPPPV